MSFNMTALKDAALGFGMTAWETVKNKSADALKNAGLDTVRVCVKTIETATVGAFQLVKETASKCTDMPVQEFLMTKGAEYPLVDKAFELAAQNPGKAVVAVVVAVVAVIATVKVAKAVLCCCTRAPIK